MPSLRALQQPPFYADFLRLEVFPAAQRIEGCWLRPVSSTEYRAGYGAMLDEAVAAGCPYWLVDIRRRTSPTEADGRWLISEFMPSVPQRLGTAAFMGTLFPPNFLEPVSPPHPIVPNAHQPAPHVLLRNFADEASLRDWLRRCRPPAH